MSVIGHDLRRWRHRDGRRAAARASRGRGESKEKDITARIRSASFDLSRMVDDLLDISRIEAHRLALDRSCVDPRAIVDETVARLSHITTGVRVNVTSEPSVRSVYADAGRIGQVLGNLISNAIKYGDQASDIEVHLAGDHDAVRISVTNRGKGIAPEDLPRLFERFRAGARTARPALPGSDWDSTSPRDSSTRTRDASGRKRPRKDDHVSLHTPDARGAACRRRLAERRPLAATRDGSRQTCQRRRRWKRAPSSLRVPARSAFCRRGRDGFLAVPRRLARARG